MLVVYLCIVPNINQNARKKTVRTRCLFRHNNNTWSNQSIAFLGICNINIEGPPWRVPIIYEKIATYRFYLHFKGLGSLFCKIKPLPCGKILGRVTRVTYKCFKRPYFTRASYPEILRISIRYIKSI